MTAPHGRSYPDGSIIYVDPAQAGGVVSGDRVIAKVAGEDLVTFKVFIDDGGTRFLKPLNPASDHHYEVSRTWEGDRYVDS